MRWKDATIVCAGIPAHTYGPQPQPSTDHDTYGACTRMEFNYNRSVMCVSVCVCQFVSYVCASEYVCVCVRSASLVQGQYIINPLTTLQLNNVDAIAAVAAPTNTTSVLLLPLNVRGSISLRDYFLSLRPCLNAHSFALSQFCLPLMHQKTKAPQADIETEALTHYWQVDDMFTFENIGFSHTLKNCKYLICADCEMGPVGYHDVTTKCCYIALKRVKHV